MPIPEPLYLALIDVNRALRHIERRSASDEDFFELEKAINLLTMDAVEPNEAFRFKPFSYRQKDPYLPERQWQIATAVFHIKEKSNLSNRDVFLKVSREARVVYRLKQKRDLSAKEEWREIEPGFQKKYGPADTVLQHPTLKEVENAWRRYGSKVKQCVADGRRPESVQMVGGNYPAY